MTILFIVLVILILLAILFFSVLATYVVHPKRHTLESCRA